MNRRPSPGVLPQRSRALAGGHHGRRPPLQPDRQPDRRDGEGDRVDEQRRRRIERRHERPGRQEADHLRQLQRQVGQRRRDDVPVALQDVGHQRRPRRLERWRAHRDQQEQAQQDGQRHAGDGHDGQQDRAEHIGRDQHPVPGEPVGEGRQQWAAQQPGEVTDGEGQRRQERGVGALVHQHRQRHAGQLVAGRGQQERAEQRPELPDREDLPERRRPGRPLLGRDVLRRVGAQRDPSRHRWPHRAGAPGCGSPRPRIDWPIISSAV